MRAGSLLVLSFVAMAAAAYADDALVPLFVIERSVNGNTVHYDAKLKDGKIDPQQPVVAYWILSENGTAGVERTRKAEGLRLHHQAGQGP